MRINQTTYPVRHAGSFECSDRLLNDVWKAGAYTVQLCMEDAFIDSPHRDRAQWWADARIESQVAYYVFDDTKLLAQGLRQISGSQNRDGAVMGLYPAGEEELVPDFSFFWIFSILDYYAFSDDAGLVIELYPKVKRLLNWFETFEDRDGLLADVPGWLFIDRGDLEKRGNSTALNCLYCQALRVSSVIAAVAEAAGDVEHYVEKSDRLRVAINKHLYAPKRGLYVECRADGKLVERFSRQANILAALFDVPDHYQKSTIHRQLLNGPLPPLVTSYFASHLLAALYAGDHHEEALDYIRGKWGPMVRDGAGTLWEQFNTEGGLCHGWAACPTRDLMAEYLGIKPVLGSHRFSVAPHAAGLKWANGSINTRTGPLKVDWRTTRDTIIINVDVPDGAKVDIYPPGGPDITVTVDGKAWPSRFVTVGAGSHTVRATVARLPGPAPIDESLKPKPIPHVEIVGREFMPYRRREISGLSRVRSTRNRRQSRAIADEPVVEVSAEAETVTTEVSEQPPTGDKQPSDTRSRSARRPRRGTRSRRKPASDHEQAAAPADSAPSAPIPAVEPRPDEAPAEKTARRRRRPYRRSGSRLRPGNPDQKPEGSGGES
ncbi:MAG: hypothetical protein A2Z18_04880 [Armatimonadetes bacterium RBG_16_58_9]|nr:MAG: hypothetical protein A2Z18_04880 [Armatimonadetes bacterium RBG_16_58_9]